MLIHKAHSTRFAGLMIALSLTVVCVSAQNPSLPKSPVTPVPFKVVDDPNVPSGWRRYQMGEAPNFSLILPAAPDASAEHAPGIETAVAHLYVSSNDNAVYAASRVQGLAANMESAPEERRASFFKSYIEGFARGFQASMQENKIVHELKMLPPTKVTAANRGGYQQDFTVGPLTGRAQLTFAGTSAFCIVTVWGPRAPPADRESFFRSFQLTGTPK